MTKQEHLHILVPLSYVLTAHTCFQMYCRVTGLEKWRLEIYKVRI